MNTGSFDNREFEQVRNEYRAETEKRWGGTRPYAEYKKKTAESKKEDWNKLGKGMNAIIAEFAELNASGEKATGKAAHELA